MAKEVRRAAPILNTLEVLLQGHPEEFLDEALPDQPESDRAAMVACARRWMSNANIRADEFERIRLVWIEGVYRPPLNVDRARREELRGLIRPGHPPKAAADRVHGREAVSA